MWGVDPRVLQRVQMAADDFTKETLRNVFIISGFRTRAEQDDLRRRGRPAADDNRSTHRSCPATGVDVSLGPVPILVHKQIWGRLLAMNGLRWGGGSDLDENLIPLDWQHADVGPR